MIIYSDENPPKRGTGLKIYRALKAEGWKVEDLHYNPPCWGNNRDIGYGTWACCIRYKGLYLEVWCGVSDNVPYIQAMTRPFNRYTIEGSNKICK